MKFLNRKLYIRRQKIHARVQRNSVLVENTNGITPIDTVANPCRMDMDCMEKDLHEYSFVSEQLEFLCVR